MKLKFFYKLNDDSHEFLPLLSEIEETPINPAGRTTFWIIVCLIFFTILWLFFAQVDIVVTARGKIIPDGEIKIIQPLETGVIKDILVKEGDYVRKGQTLIEIDSSLTKPELEALEKNLKQIKTMAERLDAAAGESFFETASPTQKKLYQSELSDLQNQLNIKNQEISQIASQINSAKSEKENYQKLLNLNLDKERRMLEVSDIIASNELDRVRSENMNYRTNISTLNQKINELMHRQKQVADEKNYIKSNFKTQHLNQLSDVELKETSLESDIEKIKFRDRRQSITSPVDGYVNTLLVHTIGGVVTPAKEIISIVPVNTPLCAKVSVLNKDIGFVKEKMPVQIKIDTFDFQKYGMIEGVVKKVSKDSVEDKNQGLVYDVFITPVSKTLIVDGKEQSITTGMSLSAEIKTGKRRIIEFFIYPIIKYWSEAVTIK